MVALVTILGICACVWLIHRKMDSWIQSIPEEEPHHSPLDLRDTSWDHQLACRCRTCRN